MAKKFAPGDTVVTFNWDGLLESTLWEAGLWAPGKGYGFDVAFDGAYPCGRRLEQRLKRDSPVRVLKAHGSINWVRRVDNEMIALDDCDVLFGLPFAASYPDRRRSEEDLDDPLVLGPIIDAPVYLKRYDDPALIKVWEQIVDALREAKEITVLGYSLPGTDGATRAQLAYGFLKNRRCRSVTVVAPGGARDSLWPDFLRTAGKACEPVDARFEDWVTAAPRTREPPPARRRRRRGLGGIPLGFDPF